MSISEDDCEFVVCKNCIRAFDVRNFWMKNYSKKVKVIMEKPLGDDPDKDGIETIFEAECPYCFHINKYSDISDAHFPERIADVVHGLKTGSKPPSTPRQRPVRTKTGRGVLPYN